MYDNKHSAVCGCHKIVLLSRYSARMGRHQKNGGGAFGSPPPVFVLSTNKSIHILHYKRKSPI